MTNFKKIKRKLLKDPEIKQAYDGLKPEFDLIIQNIKKQNSENSTTITVSQNT